MVNIKYLIVINVNIVNVLCVKMEETVHIIPLGYEIDRVVKPFQDAKGFRANRVHLISSLPGIEGRKEVLETHLDFALKVKEELEKMRIEVKLVPSNLIDILGVIQSISKIVLEERSQGNLVYINMSGAGRLTSVASTLVGMVHNVKVYYVDADEYADRDPRMKERGYSIIKEESTFSIIPNFQIKMPNKIQLMALSYICTPGGVYTNQLIKYLAGNNIPSYPEDYEELDRKKKTAIDMKLNRQVINSLLSQGYITKEKTGKNNLYEISTSGRYVASINGIIA